MKRHAFIIVAMTLGIATQELSAQIFSSDPVVARPHISAVAGRAGVNGNQPLYAARFAMPLSPITLIAEVGTSGYKTLGCSRTSCRLTSNPAYIGAGGLQLHVFNFGPVYPYAVAAGGFFAWTDKHAGNPFNLTGQPEEDPSALNPLVLLGTGANVQLRRRFEGTFETGYRGILRDGELDGGVQVLGGLRLRL